MLRFCHVLACCYMNHLIICKMIHAGYFVLVIGSFSVFCDLLKIVFQQKIALGIFFQMHF